jgi:hypothetical protein
MTATLPGGREFTWLPGRVVGWENLPSASFAHILLRMPLPNDVQRVIQSKIAVKNDQLTREMNADRSEVGAQLAARGMGNSSARVHQDIDAIERWVNKRMTAHVDIYLETLAALGIRIDSELEAEIVRHLEGLASARHAASPPGMGMANMPSMRNAYQSRLESADRQALLEGINRVKMARLIDAARASQPQPPIVSHTHNYTATGPNARVNLGSTDNSSNVVETGTPPRPTEPRKESWSFSDRLALVLFCLACVIALVLAWMEKTPIWAGATIGGMALLIAYPVLHVYRTWVKRIPALIAVWALIALFGWKIWPRPVAPKPQPVVRNEPASPQPTATVPPLPHRTKSPRLTIVQSSISGATEVLITAEERFPHPVFRVLCSAPCTLGQSGAVSLAYRAGAPEASDDLTVITVPIEIPGEIDAGQQIYLDLLPKGNSPISIRSVNGYPVRGATAPSKPK